MKPTECQYRHWMQDKGHYGCYIPGPGNIPPKCSEQYDDQEECSRNCPEQRDEDRRKYGGNYKNSLISLDIDFSKSKVGDKCWSALNGQCLVDKVEVSEDEAYVWALNQNGYTADYSLNGYQHPKDNHPGLVHSYEQFIAYWKKHKPETEKQ